MSFFYCRRLKEQRKIQQERNKREKENQKELLKKKSLEGIERKKKEYLAMKGKSSGNIGEEKKVASEGDSDSEYYRQEVGQEPDKGMWESLFKCDLMFST